MGNLKLLDVAREMPDCIENAINIQMPTSSNSDREILPHLSRLSLI